jgi:hypothetical protein
MLARLLEGCLENPPRWEQGPAMDVDMNADTAGRVSSWTPAIELGKP